MMQGAVYDTFQHLVQLASSWFRCAASAPGGLVFCNKHRLPLGDSKFLSCIATHSQVCSVIYLKLTAPLNPASYLHFKYRKRQTLKSQIRFVFLGIILGQEKYIQYHSH